MIITGSFHLHPVNVIDSLYLSRTTLCGELWKTEKGPEVPGSNLN